MIIIDLRCGNRSVLDHVVAHHGFKVSTIWMDNNCLVFASEFVHINFFLGETFKILQDSLYEGHVLFLWFQCVVDTFHTCWIEPPHPFGKKYSVRYIYCR